MNTATIVPEPESPAEALTMRKCYGQLYPGVDYTAKKIAQQFGISVLVAGQWIATWISQKRMVYRGSLPTGQNIYRCS